MRSPYLIYTLLVLLTLWLSSGTLAPYAATLPAPVVDPECGYLLNWDHEFFVTTFHFLDGAPPELWNRGLMFRRILFPLLSYVPSKIFGFIVGGVLTSAFLHLAAGLMFLRFIGQSYSSRAQLIAALILGTFPGVAYFGTSPYPYACIVPLSLLSFMLLTSLEKSIKPRFTALTIGLAMGLISLGYDLIPFTVPAGVVLLLMRKEFLAGVIYVIASASIPAFWGWVSSHYFSISLLNANTEIYRAVLNAYLRFYDANFTVWWRLLSELPMNFAHDALFSTFAFLPFAAAVIAIRRRMSGHALLSRVEAVWLSVIFIVWLFNNAAPPYTGWQLRGTWVARLYEPAFVALLVFYCRAASQSKTMLSLVVTAFLLLGQSVVVFGPWLGAEKVSAAIYTEFYTHSSSRILPQNIATFGKYPLGTCPAGKTKGAAENLSTATQKESVR